MKSITTNQIIALRGLAENGEQPSVYYGNKLREWGFVTLVNTRWELTAEGREWHRAYVRQTGDGPETLKELLRF